MNAEKEKLNVEQVASIGWSHKATEEFVNEMASQHRTCQQDFTRLCLAWLEHIAQNDRHDLRNEASVQLAKAVVNLPHKVRCLPRI